MELLFHMGLYFDHNMFKSYILTIEIEVCIFFFIFYVCVGGKGEEWGELNKIMWAFNDTTR